MASFDNRLLPRSTSAVVFESGWITESGTDGEATSTEASNQMDEEYCKVDFDAFKTPGDGSDQAMKDEKSQDGDFDW